MKNESGFQTEPSEPERHLTNSQLVISSILPFLSEEDEKRIVYKRNLNEKETDRSKIIQKRIEYRFESTIFLITEQILDRWSHLVRDKDGNLNCPTDAVIPLIFKKFNDATRKLQPLTDGEPHDVFTVPEFHKPKTLIQAYGDYQANYELLSTLNDFDETAVA